MLGTRARRVIPQRSVKPCAKRFHTQFNDLGGLSGPFAKVSLKD
jgi:hypothetical protein